MNREEKELLKKLRNNPNFNENDIKRLEQEFQKGEAEKLLMQIMKKYGYTVDELKELLEGID